MEAHVRSHPMLGRRDRGRRIPARRWTPHLVDQLLDDVVPSDHFELRPQGTLGLPEIKGWYLFAPHAARKAYYELVDSAGEEAACAYLAEQLNDHKIPIPV